MNNVADELKKFIRDVPDFPKKGIIFKDITPLLADKEALAKTIKILADNYRNKGITRVLGVESRGFLLAAPVAVELGAGVVPVRKKGKLPHDKISAEYALEYGTDSLEIHSDAVAAGEKVIVIDDLLATGGTCAAVCEMVKRLKGTVAGIGMLIELAFLNGRDKLKGHDLFILIKY